MKEKVLIVGDIGYGIFDEFRKNHPKKFYNFGEVYVSLYGPRCGSS